MPISINISKDENADDLEIRFDYDEGIDKEKILHAAKTLTAFIIFSNLVQPWRNLIKQAFMQGLPEDLVKEYITWTFENENLEQDAGNEEPDDTVPITD